MVQNDIYNSKKRYDNFKQNLERFTKPAQNRKSLGDRNFKYHCKNPKNLEHFKKLFPIWEAKDNSYIRRLRLLMSLRLVCHATQKDLGIIAEEWDREEINKIVAFMHENYHSSKSKSDFIKDLKHLWRLLFPEKDEKGRPDELLTPYSVRHLSAKIDKSNDKRRQDKLSLEEYQQILDYFIKEPMLQCYITLTVESLVRPQEACYIKIRDIDLQDNHAKLYISEHGKEGTHGFLRCIDSYSYLTKWIEHHPFKTNPEAYLFLMPARGRQYQQLQPSYVNTKLKCACKDLNIKKTITCYSFKRNGVTYMRLNGSSDVEIQHTARWTSTKQLSNYDLSTADDTFKNELEKRGLIQANTTETIGNTKICIFCKKTNPFTNKTCEQCQRLLNRKEIIQQEQKKETEISDLKTQIQQLNEKMLQIANQLVKKDMSTIK